jgi:D-sedoheptulose 7-phosphate isomerase
MEPWLTYLGTLASSLEHLAVTDGTGATLTPADGFGRWVRLTRDLHDGGQTLYLIGNGGSAMMASHMAADACKNGHLRALAFNDASLLTATSNDVSFEEVFALPLQRLARAGDLLVSISSSGNSPNIVRALETARSLSLHIVTLSGMGADNRSRTLGDVNFYVPCARYGWIETAHQAVLHYWFDQYLNLHGQGAL